MDRNHRRNSTQPPSRYTPFFHDVPMSRPWADLSGTASKVYIVLLSQLRMKPLKNGKPDPINNGDLSAGPSMMLKYGGPSKNAVTKALKELIAGGFIVQTARRRGGNQPHLYALTCFPISEIKDKGFIRPTLKASRDYLQKKIKWCPCSRDLHITSSGIRAYSQPVVSHYGRYQHHFYHSLVYHYQGSFIKFTRGIHGWRLHKGYRSMKTKQTTTNSQIERAVVSDSPIKS